METANNNSIRETINTISAWEQAELEDGWYIHIYDKWQGVKMADIIADVEKNGFGKYEYSMMDEIAQRLANYFASKDELSQREYLNETYKAMQGIDSLIGTTLVEFYFKGQTADKLADEIEENERFDQEEEARWECIDYCARIVYNDGLCDSLDEAYRLAEDACRH